MKKQILFLTIILVLALSATAGDFAHAQEPECRDATGAVIPCPPTEQPSTGGGSGGGGGGGNPNPPTVPTATSTPVPTATALPIALPESDYLGSCTSANFSKCKDQFKCEDGLLVIEVDLYSGNGTKYDFYCIPHEKVPTIDFPLTNPDGTGVTEDTNWTSGCFGDDVDACVENLAAICDADGGDLSVWYEDDGSAGTYCENSTPADSQSAPTESPAAATDIAAVPTEDGTPTDDPTPNWVPWITVGALVILIGLLLPAVQKVRDAAARARTESHSAKVDLINKDDGGTEASDYLLEIDGIKGESKAHIKKATLFVRKSGGDQQDY